MEKKSATTRLVVMAFLIALDSVPSTHLYFVSVSAFFRLQ